LFSFYNDFRFRAGKIQSLRLNKKRSCQMEALLIKNKPPLIEWVARLT
jgi:hypothetical protein